MQKLDDKTVAAIVKAKQNGSKWGEIAAAHGMTEGRAQFHYMWGTEKKGKPTPENIVKWRNDEGASWGVISARTEITEAQVKAIYEEATKPNQRIDRVGKGGAYPTADKAAPKKAVAKKAAATPTKAVAKKAPEANPTGAKTTAKGTKVSRDGLSNLDLAGMKARLEGATIRLGRSDSTKSEMVAVKTVTKVADGTVTFINAKNNGSRVVKIASIQAIGKPVEPRPTKAVAKKAAAAPAA